MLKTVHIIPDTLDSQSIETYQVEDILAFLVEHFGSWPETGRIYHNTVSLDSDVTPVDAAGIQKLAGLEGEVYCVIYPAGWPMLVMALIAVVAVAIALRPKIPNVVARNSQSQSPNNGLSERTNAARVKGRVPDILGTVRAVPDLIALPYVVYENNQEVEDVLTCIGRGQYEIHDCYDSETKSSHVLGTSVQAYLPYSDLRTSEPYFQVGQRIVEPFVYTTRSNSVTGQVLRGPNSKRLHIGEGDVEQIKFWPDGSITTAAGRNLDDYFTAGDTLTISTTVFGQATSAAAQLMVSSSSSLSVSLGLSVSLPAGLAVGSVLSLGSVQFPVQADPSEGFTVNYMVWVYNLSGVYTVTALNIQEILEEDAVVGYFCEVTLDAPHLVNAQWLDVATHGPSALIHTSLNLSVVDTLNSIDGSYSVVSAGPRQIILDSPELVSPGWLDLPAVPKPVTATLQTSGLKWVGPFILEDTTRVGVLANFVAANGLYKDSGEAQYAAYVQIRLEVTPTNLADQPTAEAVTITTNLLGSSINRNSCATTARLATAFAGRCSVRACRVTPEDTGFTGSVVDEVKWKDLYGYVDMPTSTFGNVTVVRSRSYATFGALSLKERKLNMLVTRQINEYLGGTSFSADLRSVTRASDILMFVAMDPKIGGRSSQELDLANIHQHGYVRPLEYFGTAKACDFCYTMDSEDLSYEETVKMIASAVFCTAYREGSVMRLAFEQETDDSTLLFNHRNKVPRTEVRTVTFGTQDDADGIELDYVSPEDDAIITYYLPADRTAVNPKRIETAGIRNKLQAHFHACRSYNKLLHQNLAIEFEATAEADMVVPSDRVLVSDNTRPNTQDGEIIGQSGLVVHTSQKLKFVSGSDYTMFLQLYDGTVQAIQATPGPTLDSALLAEPPNLQLQTDSDLYARTTYILVSSEQVLQSAFLVSSKGSQDNMTCKISAGNYDARFYGNDRDFINLLITE